MGSGFLLLLNPSCPWMIPKIQGFPHLEPPQLGLGFFQVFAPKFLWEKGVLECSGMKLPLFPFPAGKRGWVVKIKPWGGEKVEKLLEIGRFPNVGNTLGN